MQGTTLFGTDRDIMKKEGVVVAGDVYEDVLVCSSPHALVYSIPFSTYVSTSSYLLRKDCECYHPRYNAVHGHVYDRLSLSYERLSRHPLIPKKEKDETSLPLSSPSHSSFRYEPRETIWAISAFYNINSGHDLAFLMNLLIERETRGWKDSLLVMACDMYPFVKDVIQYLMGDTFFSHTLFIDAQTVLRVDKMHVIPAPIMFHPSLLPTYRTMIETIQERISPMDLRLSPSSARTRIALLKTPSQQFIRNDVLLSESQRTVLEAMGFHVVHPEQMETAVLLKWLFQAQDVVAQWGSITYTNILFVPLDAKILYLTPIASDTSIYGIRSENVTLCPYGSDWFHVFLDLFGDDSSSHPSSSSVS